MQYRAGVVHTYVFANSVVVGFDPGFFLDHTIFTANAEIALM
jgi:hypothetical protein